MNFYEKIRYYLLIDSIVFLSFLFFSRLDRGTIESPHRISRDVRNYEVCNNKPRCSGIMDEEGGGRGRGEA